MLTKRQKTILLNRANMDRFGFNTSVVCDPKNKRRLMVGSSFDRLYGDCLSVSFNNGNDAYWHSVTLSPARARILIEHLERNITHLEKQNGKTLKINEEHGT